MRKLLRKHGKTPKVMVTDKLRSCAAANRKLGLKLEHHQHKGLNNRAENSHQPSRVREKLMRHYNRDAKQKREMRTQALAAWNEVTRAKMAMV